MNTLVFLGAQRHRQTVLIDDLLQFRNDTRGYQLRKPVANRAGPLLLLTSVGRKRFRPIADQIWNQLPDVVGQVDVLGEPADRGISLGERGAALKDQMLADRRAEECGERPDNPDVLFEQVSRPAVALTRKYCCSRMRGNWGRDCRIKRSVALTLSRD